MHDENQYIYMNKYIDSLPMFLNWEMDVIIIFLGGFGTWLVIGGTFGIICFLTSLIIAYFKSKLKTTKYKNYFFHLLYSLGFVDTKNLPKSHEKYFVG